MTGKVNIINLLGQIWQHSCQFSWSLNYSVIMIMVSLDFEAPKCKICNHLNMLSVFVVVIDSVFCCCYSNFFFPPSLFLCYCKFSQGLILHFIQEIFVLYSVEPKCHPLLLMFKDCLIFRIQMLPLTFVKYICRHMHLQTLSLWMLTNKKCKHNYVFPCVIQQMILNMILRRPKFSDIS